MNKPSQPSELARETLRQLALRKIPPTPDNYLTLYHEIAGTQVPDSFPERSLKALHSALPRQTPDQVRLARQIEGAISSGSWDSLRSALTDFVGRTGGEGPNWSGLIRELAAQLDTRHTGLSPAKKREALEHVLTVSANPELLHSRLQSVVRSWSQTPTDTQAVDTQSGEAAPAEKPAAVPAAAAREAGGSWRGGIGELQDLICQLLDNTVTIALADSPELARDAAQISSSVRGARNAEELVGVAERLKKLAYRAHFVAEDQAELKTALMHLIRLIVDNINELVVDDQWLSGQIEVVRQLINEPLNLRRLDDVERRLKDVIVKQSSLKKSLNEAKDRLKQMLASFVDRLADFTASTSGYHDKIEKCATKISQARDIGELSDVLDEVMRETRVIQLNAARSRDEMTVMKGRVEDAEREVSRLQNELAQASELVRHDPLTGALNRKGMDEAMDIEVSRARRQGGHLSFALLDVDNFKKLNDTLGHAAGDAALTHLAGVVRSTIRPQDTLARYGGEEFVVLLPGTPLDDAVSAMVRVQRELTRRFFLHNNDKVLITFSCGVAEMREEEDAATALARADEAMYLAKRSGKNRVVPA